MPELPEVETVVGVVRPLLVGRRIAAFQALWPKVTAPEAPSAFARKVAGKTIERVTRRGKYILLGLDLGTIHIHLRMTGRLMVAAPGQDLDSKHLSARFDLAEGGCLVFRDMRKFGRIGYLDDLAPLEARLGPEPLAPDLTAERFHAMLGARRRQLKPLLLDQGFLAGLGNIYVDEALFAARLHPEARASGLTIAQAGVLLDAIRDILRQSIDHKGTTIINFQYAKNSPGQYRERLQVFGRAGQPCPACGAAIVKSKVAQRGTHWCPQCQAVDE